MTTEDIEAVRHPEEAWESGELGRDPQYARCAPEELKKEIESALEMQMISIRLHLQLIEELKLIAKYRGVGYQPLIREVLRRFARSEIVQIAREFSELERARETLEKEQGEQKRA